MGGEKELQEAYKSILGQHFEEAVAWFQKAIEQEPANSDYHYKLSITYARSGKIEEALAAARKALALKPGYSDYEIQVNTLTSKQLIAQAEQLLQDGRGSPLAVTYLREALRLNPLEERTYVLLAEAYARMREYKDAIGTLRELLALDPEHKLAISNLEQYKQLFADYLEEPYE